MCTIDNIRLAMPAVTAVKLIIALYICVIGGIFSSSDELHKAYGVFFASTGAGIVMIGLTSAFMSIPQTFAVKRHNRFVLLVCFAIDTILMTQAITAGLSVYEPTIPVFDSQLQKDCLLHAPKIYTQEECDVYLRSERIAGFKLVWASYFSQLSDADYFATVSNMEDRNLCCGFGPPKQCRNDTRPFPSDRPLDNVKGYLAKDRIVCGEKPFFYPEQKNCIDYFDENSIPQIVGGCDYDLGGGGCVELDIEDSMKGCADVLEGVIANKVAPHALIIMGSSGLSFLSMMISCCMYWKRKESDVFPDFLHEEKVRCPYSSFCG